MAKKHYNQTIGFADRLNEAISDIGMSQKQLAEMIGMERKSVSMWVNGYSMPNSLILARICKVLSVSADYLLFGEKRSETMRVISQSGIFDFPYEQIVVCMDGNNVIARFVGIEKSNLLGSYSTEENAEKAMEMLRGEWLDYADNGLFQFPKDEDVEV